MAGLSQPVGSARQAWQESMERQLASLRTALQQADPALIAARSGGSFNGQWIELAYWGERVQVYWPEGRVFRPEGEERPLFDQAMLLYYLGQADGSPPSGRWIGFRDLPGGTFYNQAFQGYTGDELGRGFGSQPESFARAAVAAGGSPAPELAPLAFVFQPLPRILTAAVLWPGDEDFPARGQVLFDAACSHYLVTDGLALIGSGLVRRIRRMAA